GLNFLVMAKKLEPVSKNELNNSFLGGKLLNQFNSIDEIYDYFIENYNVKPNDIMQAQENVEAIFRMH
ncbi:MAG: hypothetical protein K2X39_08985, partial [Silvanigrellaceae bacterium]|nr:hypothetical protein [Silvanigrellaceae bacterium]